jgi:molecular chaperone GrpE (heat shock protein)
MITPEMRQAIQQLRMLESQLRQVQGTVGQVEPQDRNRLASLMSSLMGQVAELINELDRAAEQLTPSERQQLSNALQRMNDRLVRISQIIAVSVTPTPVVVPTPAESLDDLAQQASQLQAQIQQQATEIDPQAMADMADQLSGLIGDLANVLDSLTPALARISRQEQEQIAGTVRDMQLIVQQMLQVTSRPAPTVTPTPS